MNRRSDPWNPWARPAHALDVDARLLSDHILSSRTATEALQRWCDARAIGRGSVVAVKHRVEVAGPSRFGPPVSLCAGPNESVVLRAVSLVRGEVELSRAHNWYVPQRLPPAVAACLETTDVPFGAAVATLAIERRTIAVRHLRPDGDPPISGETRGTVLEHDALIVDAGGRILAVVSERYGSVLLAPAPGEHHAAPHPELRR
ncbi:MAG: hypothetical protein KDE35_07905 [Geminicoccaceae bacterium]|nr:hypothetical protein [Geminicoccaceae bacterium]